LVLGDIAGEYPDFFEGDELPERDDSLRSELDTDFGRYGHKSWTGLTIHERVEAIEELWVDDKHKQTLRFFRDIPHRQNNQLLHLGAYSLNQTVRRHEAGGIVLTHGPSGHQIQKALLGAHWIYAQTIGLMIDEFSLGPREEFDALAKRHVPMFRTLDPEETRGLGRNDPCPCDSGKKFKKCHGRWS
ncbi:hypothetical protein LCGC14_2910380, partial [marine sediment metagenome]